MTDFPNSSVPAAVDEAIAWYFAANPAEAAAMGSTDPAHTRTLGDLSAAGFEQRERGSDEVLARLDALAETPAAFDDEIDRDLVRAQLRGEQILAGRQRWRSDT